MKPSGGPAFPIFYGTNCQTSGMSLRDYFAAHASDEDIKDIMDHIKLVLNRREARYFHADRMLEERRK